jgi:hypothetical protein
MARRKAAPRARRTAAGTRKNAATRKAAARKKPAVRKPARRKPGARRKPSRPARAAKARRPAARKTAPRAKAPARAKSPARKTAARKVAAKEKAPRKSAAKTTAARKRAASKAPAAPRTVSRTPPRLDRARWRVGEDGSVSGPLAPPASVAGERPRDTPTGAPVATPDVQDPDMHAETDLVEHADDETPTLTFEDGGAWDAPDPADDGVDDDR